MLKAHPVAGKQKSSDICAAFIAGAPKHVVGHCFYGVNATNVKEWRQAKAVGEDWFYIDGPYFDKTRGTHFRITKNALQNSGIGESDGRRLSQLGIEVKPWQTGGTYRLVCPQSDSFMSTVIGYRGSWLDDTMERVKNFGGETRVRPWSADKPALARTLQEDLAGAFALYTHTSSAAVTALLEGVPVFDVSVLSAAYAMADVPRETNDEKHRRRWAEVLADAQFTIQEMRDGTAWRMLNP